MQDRFKFRIWNKNSNQYSSIGLGTALTVNNISEDFIIQQCLGIADKTGRLIYEGDVVTYSPIYEEVVTSSISEVIYSNACFLTKNIRVGKCKRYNEDMIQWFKQNHNEDVSNEIELYSPTDEYGTDWINVEIIGSIADNKLVDLNGQVIGTLTTFDDTIKLLNVS